MFYLMEVKAFDLSTEQRLLPIKLGLVVERAVLKWW